MLTWLSKVVESHCPLCGWQTLLIAEVHYEPEMQQVLLPAPGSDDEWSLQQAYIEHACDGGSMRLEGCNAPGNETSDYLALMHRRSGYDADVADLQAALRRTCLRVVR